MVAPDPMSTISGSKLNASLSSTKSRGSRATDPSRPCTPSCSVTRPMARSPSSSDEATVASTPLMVTISPERGPRLAIREWIRSEVDRPGSSDSGRRPGPGRTEPIEIDWSMRLYRHTSSFSVGNGAEEKASAAAVRRFCSQGGPARAAAVSGVKLDNVDRTGTSRASRPASRASSSILPGHLGGPTSGGPGGREGTPAPAAYALAMTPSPGTAIDTFSSEVLAIETDGHVATLWLDRPEKRNAMGPAFWSDLPRGHGRHRVRPRDPGRGGGGPGAPLLRRARPGGHVRAHRVGRRPAARARSRWPPGPVRPATRSSACRPRSPRSPTARCRSSPPSTGTASVAAWT